MLKRNCFLSLAALLGVGAFFLTQNVNAFWGFEWDFDLPDFDDFTFQSGSYTCPHTWDFNTSSDYFYNTAEIQVTGGKASAIDSEDSYANAVVIATKYGTPYAGLTSFSDSFESNPKLFGTVNLGEIRYQLSPDAAHWYYFKIASDTWEESTTSSFSEANTSDIINSKLSSYNSIVGDGVLFIRAFIQSGYFAGMPGPFGTWMIPPFFSKASLNSITVNCSTFTFPDFEFTPPGSDFWEHFFDSPATETCSDGILNQDETGIDCGGVTCTACSSGDSCTAAPTDLYWGCDNPPYSASSTCLDNGRLNYLMAGCNDVASKCCNSGGTGWDCYLTSSKCAKPSGIPASCSSGYTLTSTSFGNICLESGTPASTCVNAVKDGDETGVDCGGSCPACTVTPTCTDDIQNGTETGVDCGGSCSACPVTPSGTCSDGILNQDETSIDCGGGCSACPVVTATCSDGVLNQDETSIDCGGVTCAACPVSSGSFVDVPDDNPHAEAIQELKDRDIISGYDTTHFGPSIPLRRGELLKIALNGAGIDSSAYLYGSNPYSDLADDHSLKQYILYAYHNNIATGYGGGLFGPDNYTTYAEAAKMLLNINGISAATPPAGVTYNLPANSDLIGFVHKAMTMNLLYEPASFTATNNILRDYTAEMMYRILIVKEDSLSVYVAS